MRSTLSQPLLQVNTQRGAPCLAPTANRSKKRSALAEAQAESAKQRRLRAGGFVAGTGRRSLGRRPSDTEPVVDGWCARGYACVHGSSRSFVRSVLGEPLFQGLRTLDVHGERTPLRPRLVRSLFDFSSVVELPSGLD